MHDDRAERRAALTGGSKAAEEGALAGEIEIGVGHHHERVLAARARGRATARGARTARRCFDPTGDEPVKPTLSISFSSSARSRPSKALGPSHCTTFSTPSGRPPLMNSRPSASPSAGAYSAGFHTTALPQRIAGTRYHDGTATGKLPGRDDRGHADRRPEGEELLVRHLARHGLAVEPPALAEEEVAGVDDLLHLAERLRVGLADLARDQARERLLVLLHEATDLLDRLAAHRRRDRGPARAEPRARRDRRRRTRPRRRARPRRRPPRAWPGCATRCAAPPSRSFPPMIEATVLVSVMLMAGKRSPSVGGRLRRERPLRDDDPPTGR